MELYEIRFKSSVRKDLRNIPKSDVNRILRRIEELAGNPRPKDSKKLTGEALYRIRLGLYRIVYEIVDRDIVVTVVKIGHRKDVYR